MTDLTDPKRGFFQRFGILWKVQLQSLSPEDAQECLRQKALLPKDPQKPMPEDPEQPKP